MTDINKQRFLPELAKLLTFMCEEDRQTALAMYDKCFEDTVDEQKLMDLLVSPTRQAVVIARTYNAKERRQQLADRAAGKAEPATPAFMLAIDKIYQQVAPQQAEPAAPVVQDTAPAREPNKDQFSLFPDDTHPIDDEEYLPVAVEAPTAVISEPVDDLPVEPAEAADLQPGQPAPAGEEHPRPPAPEPRHMAPEPAPADDGAAPAAEEEASAPVPEAQPAEPAPAEPAPAEHQSDELDLNVPKEHRTEAAEPVAGAPGAQAAPAPAEPPKTAADLAPTEEHPGGPDMDYIPETRRQARVFLLILYTLIAVPVVLLGVLLLLLPTILTLALAVVVVMGGAATLVAAFSGFPKLADILIVLGTAVIVLALGLLALWLFVWFVGGAIGGLIRGAIALGRKWCYKEVPV